MIETFLEILTAVFAVFGLYAFSYALCAVIFRNDKVGTVLLVDSAQVASEIEMYLYEAKNACFLFGGRKLLAVIRQPYATAELLEILNRKRIPYEIVMQNGQSEV